eukprot:s1400_g11.t1
MICGRIHVAFLFLLATLWRLLQHPTFELCCQLIVSVCGYLLHACSEGKITTDRHFLYLEVIACSIHFVFALGIASESDLVLFCCQEKMCNLVLFFLSVMLIDLKAVLMLYLVEAMIFTYRLWCLIGLENLTTMVIFATLTSHFVLVFTLVLIVHNMRSNIAAKQTSGTASSLMRGFRHVLRGVSDGDLLLERKSCEILDDASCLERLLKSKKKLCETNFLDLFLDAEGRQNFLHFLNVEDPSAATMPRGLRVSLQGADGPVSLDLFHTRIPSQDSGVDYCLLAMKEDAEQRTPPEAPPGASPLPHGPAGHASWQQAMPSQTRSSEVTEIAESFEELMEIALLFSNETGFLDIKEVRLVFQRQSWLPTIESGMPTLRRFIRPSDWDRIEQMLQNVINLPPADIERRCYFRHPMLFRVPGASRSYLCARDTYIVLGQPSIDTDRPIHFRMHLASFDSSHLLRPREQELEGIEEE